MALLLVFTASASALALEALLARYFALTQWHHLSFMVISVALLGFSASGTWLNLVATRQERSGAEALRGVPGAERRLRRAAAGMAVSAVGMFLMLRLLPLDFFRIPSEPIQLLYLAASYLACAVPFFFAGLITAIAFAAGPARPGAVYAAAMSGSAVGVLLPVLLLPAAGLRAALMVPVALLLLPLVPWSVRAAWRTTGGRTRRQWLAPTALALALALGVGVVLAHPALEPRPGPYKYLAHVLRFPDTRLVARRDTARGRIDEVTGPTTRFAPGLSLGAGSPVPPQRALVRDGDAALFLVEDKVAGATADGWLDALHPAAALHLGTPPRAVLVLQEGGGVLLAAALRHARSVQVAEPSAAIARRLRRLPVAEDTVLEVVEDEPRALARRLVRAGVRFDAVLIENWGASLAGTESHAQEPLLTVEAFRDYLALLEPEGVLSVSRRLLLPPANAPRLAAIAARALSEVGSRAPAAHLAIIRNWDSFTLLVTPQPLSAPRSARIRAFAARHGFDLVSLPGLRSDETNRFNRLAEPFHAHAVAAVLESARAGTQARAGVAGGLVDLSPPTDDRPFFNRFVRWAQLPAYQRATGGRLYGLLLSGDVVALAVLAEALVLALILLAVPWLRTGGLRAALAAAGSRHGAAGSAGPVVAYNLAVGLGFILLELMLIQRLTVALGDPVVSFKVVLGALLVWSAAGGLLSERITPPRTWLVVAAVAGVVLAYAAAGPWFRDLLLALPRVPRVASIAVLLAPLGVALGMAFPLGLRLLAPEAAGRALAWAANGCASVVGAVASTLLAVAQGITALGLVAAASYAIAALVAGLRANCRG